MLKVHGVPLSPFVRKVLYVLEHKGIEYDLTPVFPASDEPEFRAISPLGKIPALEHDGFGIADSSVICRYLDQVFPDKPVYPADPKLQARVSWLEEYAGSRLIENCATVFRQRWLNPKMGGECDEAAVENAINNELPKILAYLESVTPESGPLVSDQITIADMSVVSSFIQARYGDYEVDGSAFPKLKAYLDRAFDSAIVKNRKLAEDAAVAATFPS